jgi:hypothetical protein
MWYNLEKRKGNGMKRVLSILVVTAVLAGCSDPTTENNEVTFATNTAVKSGLTKEERMAAIEKRYNLNKTEEPSNNEWFPFAASEVLFDGKSIEDQSESEVNALLGEPTETKKGEWRTRKGQNTPYIHNVYVTDIAQIDVMFIEGKAARIAVKPKEEFK